MCLAYQGFEFKSFCFEDLLLPNAECNCHKLQEKKATNMMLFPVGESGEHSVGLYCLKMFLFC